MLIRLSWNERIKLPFVLKVLTLVGVFKIIDMKPPKFFIRTDKLKNKKECLCEKCNLNYKGHYGVGYYSCKNKDKVIKL